MSNAAPFVALRWRRPMALFVPAGLLLAAGAPGAAVFAASPDRAPLALAISGVLLLVLALTTLLCRRRDRTMPVMMATGLSVTHAVLFLAGVATLSVPAASASVGQATVRAGAEALAHSEIAAVLAAYAASFGVLTTLAAAGILMLRYAAMTKKPAEA